MPCPRDAMWRLSGFVIAGGCLGALGFYLYKKGPALSVASVGLDFFQVLAMLSKFDLQWPALVKNALEVASAALAEGAHG